MLGEAMRGLLYRSLQWIFQEGKVTWYGSAALQPQGLGLAKEKRLSFALLQIQYGQRICIWRQSEDIRTQSWRGVTLSEALWCHFCVLSIQPQYLTQYLANGKHLQNICRVSSYFILPPPKSQKTCQGLKMQRICEKQFLELQLLCWEHFKKQNRRIKFGSCISHNMLG